MDRTRANEAGVGSTRGVLREKPGNQHVFAVRQDGAKVRIVERERAVALAKLEGKLQFYVGELGGEKGEGGRVMLHRVERARELADRVVLGADGRQIERRVRGK